MKEPEHSHSEDKRSELGPHLDLIRVVYHVGSMRSMVDRILRSFLENPPSPQEFYLSSQQRQWYLYHGDEWGVALAIYHRDVTYRNIFGSHMRGGQEVAPEPLYLAKQCGLL